MKIHAFITGILFPLVFTACIKDEINLDKISNTVDWDPKYGMPVAYGSLTLKDIVETIDANGIVKEDSITKMFYLTYDDQIFSQVASDIITIPPQTYQQTYSVPVDIPVFPPSPDSITYSFSNNYGFGFSNGEEIDSIYFKTGTMSFRLRSQFQHTGRVWITLPTFKKNGVPLKFPININTASGNFDGTVIMPMSDYILKLNPTNQIPFAYEIVLNRDAGAPILTSQQVTIDINISNAMFSALYGYIGSYPILPLTSDQILLGLFDNYSSLDIEFAEPRIRLYISNSFGAPVQVQLSNLRTWSEKNQHFFNINLTTGNPFIVKAPLLSQLGDTVTTVVTFDQSNSNIFQAIPDIPHYLYYGLSATANPLGKTGSTNFVLDTSRLSVDIDVDLPFNFKATNLQQSDTIDFDLSKTVSDFGVVKKMALINTFKNSIPFDLTLQVYLMNENNIIVDSLYSASDQPIIKSGIFDSVTNRYKADPNTQPLSPVIFDNTRAKKLENVKFAILKVSLSTAGNGANYVAFYSDYRLDLAIQVQAELEVKSLDQF